MLDRRLILNATAIGHRADGIAVYGVHLVKAVWRAGLNRPLTVVLNDDARHLFPAAEIPAGAAIEWVDSRISPARGTRGNLQRWVFANRLALRHQDALVVGLSQIEAPVIGGRGIVMVHDIIPRLFRNEHPRQYYFYRYYLGRALARALAIMTPSQTTKDDLCRHYGIDGGRVHVIHHGCPVPVSTATAGTRADRYILWIGRADPAKNLPALLEAFRLIERQVNVRLVIVGEDARIDLTATGMGEATLDRVTVRGPVSEGMKISLLDGASALVCPSLYEGFGFPPIEAMARGCPVIAAWTGALPEVCGNAAVYVDPRQPAQIADAMRSVLTQPDLAQELVERGRKRASAFTWDASVRAHLAVIDRVTRLHLRGHSVSTSTHDAQMEGNVAE